MSKGRNVGTSLLNSWIQKLSDREKNNFKVDGNAIFCRPCGQRYQWKKISELQQHIINGKHASSIKNQNHSGKQTLLLESIKCPFKTDLCEALLAADIPLHKLSNDVFRGFLEKYCNKSIPDESTLRKNYVPSIFENIMKTVKLELVNRKIFMQVDETTDKKGRFVTNVLVGALSKDCPTTVHLVMTKELEKTDNASITQLVIDALQLLWPNVSQAEVTTRFLVLLTDAAPYMIKAGKNLKRIYPNLLHITCLAHGMHRVAETVRSSYKNVDELVGQIKAIFKKAPSRIQTYKEMCPDLPLPPEPVLVRWGTWLEAVEFLAINFDSIKAVILSFDENEAECIRKAQNVIHGQIGGKLAEILHNFTFLANTIKKFESRSLSLCDSIRLLEETSERLTACTSDMKEKVLDKFRYVLGNNPDLEKMSLVTATLSGSNVATDLEMSPDVIASLAYCPLTSVEVERSFSQAKALLSSRRMGFKMENFEKYLICHYELGKKYAERL